MVLTHPSLDWRGATPVARDVGDIYFSPDDALGDVRHTYVSAIAPHFGQRKVIVIGETGFGTGLNFLVTWQDWLARRRAGDRLIFVSTEAHPLRAADARRALAPFSEIAPLCEQLLAFWPVGIPGPHRRFFDVGSERGLVELWVLHGQALAELRRQTFQADAWYFDGFNPAENPSLWTAELLAECARLMAPGSLGGTFSVATSVRQAMAAAGLVHEKRPGFGRKRHCLRLYKPGAPRARPCLSSPRLHLIGGGVAGAAACYAARERGLDARLFDLKNSRPKDTHPKEAGLESIPSGPIKSASTNPVALLNFKPTRAPDTPGNRLLAAALAQVQRPYADLWLPGRGTFKPAGDAAQLAVYQACLAAMGWADSCLSLRGQPKAGLYSPLAGAVRPAQVLARLGGEAVGDEADFRQAGEGLQVWARGYGTLWAAPSLAAHLRRNRGQVDAFDARQAPAPALPTTYGGYISPAIDGRVVAGSSYDRDPDWHDPQVFAPRAQATAQIVAKAQAAGFSLPSRPQESYVAARAFGRDHQPIVGQTLEGTWVLTGLGSRGFLTAPLLAEILLDEVEGRAAVQVPTYDFKACVLAGRFVL